LGMDRVAAKLVEHMALDGADAAPSVIGVFGRWGSGKTHLLNEIGRYLDTVEPSMGSDSARLAVCCFRSWEYEAEGDLAAGMVRALGDERNYPWRGTKPDFSSIRIGRRSVGCAARELGMLVLKSAARSVPHIGPAIAEVLAILDRAKGKEDEELGLCPTATEALHQQMQQLVDGIVGKHGHLVVLVDDLDRCSPPNMVRLFEWFKNHLTCDRVTYILGLDHRMAALAIRGEYEQHLRGGDELMADYGYRYLDKLLELDFEIQPTPGVQPMALDKLDLAFETVRRYTDDALGRDFAGDREIDELLARVPAVWIPRVMIKTIQTYKIALDALLEQAKSTPQLLTSDLAPSFPYWLFLLSMLHHLFAPDEVETFADRRRDDHHPAVRELAGGLDHTDPRSSLKDALGDPGPERPARNQMNYLYRLVREKTPIAFEREVL
ncbi:MAG: hypothetical protein GF320_11165, partial [Armatimonadia bacterium]|nr:hypothetical protein [Armatimonadia bacterium]